VFCTSLTRFTHLGHHHDLATGGTVRPWLPLMDALTIWAFVLHENNNVTLSITSFFLTGLLGLISYSVISVPL
jgi:hypothetical protein